MVCRLCAALLLFAICFPSAAGADEMAPEGPLPPGLYDAEEWRLLEQGEYEGSRIPLGAVVGTVYGWGIGHLIQGRWLETGYIFTLGEGVSGVGMVAGLIGVIECNRESACQISTATFFLSGMAYLAFRITEVHDLWAGPAEHNREVRRLRQRARYLPAFSIAPDVAGGGGVVGLSGEF